MNLLDDKTKLFIVQALACFNTPTEVAEMVKEEFEIELTRQAVSRYNPTRAAGESLGAEYQEIFHATRKKFLDNVSDVPASSAAYRVAVLQKMLSEARQRKNNVLAAQHLEQIAKEVGGMYTNKVKIDHRTPDGIQMQVTEISDDALQEGLKRIGLGREAGQLANKIAD